MRRLVALATLLSAAAIAVLLATTVDLDRTQKLTVEGDAGPPQPAATDAPWDVAAREPLRGVTVGGADFGAGDNIGRDSGDEFSNLNPGLYYTRQQGGTYRYTSRDDYDYLASRDLDVVRLTFRWERIQPRLGEPLDDLELGRLRRSIEDAEAAGLLVIPEMMNYGAYWEGERYVGVRRPIGSAEVPVAAYVDAWTRIAASLDDLPNIAAYGLMNEPVDIPGGGPAWEATSLAVVQALRDAGVDRILAVPTHRWSNAHRVQDEHPNGPWVPDELGPVRYEVHQYWSAERSGTYESYGVELELAKAEGWTARPRVDEVTVRALTELDEVLTWLDGAPGWIGEVGWPNDRDVEAWNRVADAWFTLVKASDLWVTVWTTGSFWRNDYHLLAYRSSEGAAGSLDEATSVASVLESHL